MKSKKKSGHGLAVLAGIFVSCLAINAPADELADFAKPLNVEYERPGTDYARYSRLRIKDLDLSDTKIVPPPWLTEKAFKWDVPEESGDRLRQEFMDSMKEQIGGNGGYEIVTEPGEGVMELYVRIVSFMPYAERKDKVTTKGSGEMRIHAETRDAQTGELLGIYEGAQEVGKNYQPNTDFTREKNLKTLFDSWGRRIRIAMDEDHGR